MGAIILPLRQRFW